MGRARMGLRGGISGVVTNGIAGAMLAGDGENCLCVLVFVLWL